MAQRLRGEEIVTVHVLGEKGENHCEIARTLGVTEGTVRYHLNRQGAGAVDGRSRKPFKAERVAEVIAHWVESQRASGSGRPVNVRQLFEHLVGEYGYEGHYRSVLRFMRGRYPKPKIRTYRLAWKRPQGRRCRRTGPSMHG